MNFQPPSSSYDASWSPSADVLANSLMHMSITEDSETHVGYPSRFVSSVGRSLSASKSVMTNLASMANAQDDEQRKVIEASSSGDASWGFFVDA